MMQKYLNVPQVPTAHCAYRTCSAAAREPRSRYYPSLPPPGCTCCYLLLLLPKVKPAAPAASPRTAPCRQRTPAGSLLRQSGALGRQ